MGIARTVAALVASPLTMALACAANAATPGAPVKIADGLTLDPIVEGRLRYEHVDQPMLDADALTMRLRAGAELKHASGLSVLAEAEGTLGLVDDYNAFPFAVASTQRRTQFSVVPDPMNIDLNRLQLQYKGAPGTLTVGRQRFNLDDQRWVGSVAWRQNEQTFDAVRAETKLGPVSLDVAYANSQRTIFGINAQTRQAYDGDFVFAGAAAQLGPVNVKGFAYLIDYDEPVYFANSSQSYGARATAVLPLASAVKLNLMGSYARQSDYGSNPANYAADFIAAEAGLAVKALTLTAGYELLGGDAKAQRAVQTPMATLHKFNGWADVFLTTPQTAAYGGLQDIYVGAAYKIDGVKVLPGLNAAVTWHGYDSDYGNRDYGSEWNASVGFRLGQFNVLAKYANYDATGFGTDTEKLWLQLEFAY